MDRKSWQHLLHRRTNTNKYDYGHVLVIGGSPDMVGAAVLAARASVRTGAGLVTIASSKDVVQLIDRDIEEIMTHALPSWHQANEVVGSVEAYIGAHHVSVVIIGPGLPPQADECIRRLVSKLALPLVVDAEAFAALGQNKVVLRTAARQNANIILTPHLGEYARLMGGNAHDSQDWSIEDLQAFTRANKVTLVAKQHRTIVVNAYGDTYENSTGNPGMATAGSGDVLSGVIAGLLAQHCAPFDAATMGVYLHGLAGDIASQAETEPGIIASDIIDALPQALRQLDDSSSFE